MHKAWLAALAVTFVAASPARGDEWSHRYTVSGTPDLHVKTDDGSVHVEAATGAEIAARVTTEGWTIGPSGVTVVESQTGDRVSVEVRVPKGHFGWHRSVRVELQVPRQSNLEVETGDGSVEAQGVSGQLRISTGDGSITAGDLGGEIRLHSGDGSIRASGLDGRLEAHTGDGHMEVRGRFDLLDLSTGDGGIEAAVERGSKVDSPWSLRSGDGGIRVRVPEDLGADLDADTGDGSITLDAPLTVTGTVKSSSVRGKLGSGGSPFRIHTGDGSIHLGGL
jgi:DUF4097 and DUF4098 domain-containing protein YvlB